METFSDFAAWPRNLSLERWVETQVVSWGRCADGCRLRLFTNGVSFPLFCRSRSLTETMSYLDWGRGKVKEYGKDLETALQSKEARACIM